MSELLRAAEAYCPETDCVGKWRDLEIQRAFIAGAEWQARASAQLEDAISDVPITEEQEQMLYEQGRDTFENHCL